MGLVNTAEALLAPTGDARNPPALPANYQWCNGPFRLPAIVPRPGGFGWWLSPAVFGGIGSCTIPLPIDGQSYQPPIDMATSPALVYWRRHYKHSTTQNRDYVAGTVQRIGPAVSPQAKPHPMVLDYGATDPNLLRHMPAAPGAEVQAKFKRGVGTPLRQPTAFANPELPYAPDFAWRWEFTPGQTAVDPIVDFAGPTPPGTTPGVPVDPPVKRQPPPQGEKQRKSIPYAKKVVIAIYKGLDVASEGAEIIDAVYDALPDSVKKRWNRPDRMGDNFGQYGPDGADWKMQAIYHNAHKIDVEQALKNIIKNGLSDAVTGGIQAQLPKNTGAAHSQGEKEFHRRLDEWLNQEFGFE